MATLVSPTNAVQNLNLGLQVLLASDSPMPDSVQQMTASDLVENPVNLFILCESLRQLQKLKKPEPDH